MGGVAAYPISSHAMKESSSAFRSRGVVVVPSLCTRHLYQGKQDVPTIIAEGCGWPMEDTCVVLFFFFVTAFA